MGRKRTNNPLGLPNRVYAKHGAFYYVHRDNRWEKLGTDIIDAKHKGNLYNNPDETVGTMAYYLDMFIIWCEKRVARDDLKQQTLDDYKTNLTPLKAFFGKMQPCFIDATHIAKYLDIGAEMGRPVRANRERSCLSSCFSWMIRYGEGGIKHNPCIGIKRNKETKRERYVEHEEYSRVWSAAETSVRGLLDLIYRTLQRPEDIITWTPAENLIIKREADGTMRRIIRNDQGKTGKIVDIEITPEIDEILNYLHADASIIGRDTTLIRKRNGKPYTYKGLKSMLNRYEHKVGVETFGFYDMKGKGATDMYLADVPLAAISFLCGHNSLKTTEIYIKQRWRGTAKPNSTNVFLSD